MTNIGISGSTGKIGKLLIEDIKEFPELKLVYEYSPSIKGANLDNLFQESDIVIDFSSRENTVPLITAAKKYNTKIIIGTTGLIQNDIDAINDASLCLPLIYSPNMSLGINILHIIAKQLTEILPSTFDCGITEVHHKHKKDSPSGTALMLGKIIEENRGVSYASLRVGNICGEHEIIFTSEHETIKIHHGAKNRRVFSIGALKAAVWLSKQNIPGLYSIADVI